MRLRTLATTELMSPPEGCITLAVARHVAATSSDPDIPFLHRRRAEMIHALVDDLSIEVHDWGATDSEHPSEIVELIIGLAPTVVEAAAAVMAAWITRPERKPKDNKGLLGLKLKRTDGAELEITYHAEANAIGSLIEDFMRGAD